MALPFLDGSVFVRTKECQAALLSFGPIASVFIFSDVVLAKGVDGRA
jgi:hypothetical protein